MEPILKDLCALIRKSTIHYNDTCEQKDVVMTDDFKDAFGGYLREQNYMVDFYRYTAEITTPVGNYMFVPNQWFVIAAYAVGVYSELIKYKGYLMQICSFMGEKPTTLVRKLRDNTGAVDRQIFFDGCESLFIGYSSQQVADAKMRLWRFATDYSWWSGHKTVDRGDFYLSVILDMLSLVAASQSFVGDIVSDYYKAGMTGMVAELSDFTEGESGATYNFDGYKDPKNDYTLPKRDKLVLRETGPQLKSGSAVDDGDEIVISVRSKK